MAAERTWVVKTDGDGAFDLQKDADTLKVSGDEWYLDQKGKPYFPLGTVTVTETKAPEGYLVNAEPKCIVIDDDNVGGGGQTVNRWQVKIDDTDEHVRRALCTACAGSCVRPILPSKIELISTCSFVKDDGELPHDRFLEKGKMK